MLNSVRDWRGGITAASVFFSLLFTSSLSFADNGINNLGRADYDLDDDGLIEITDHFDLNEIRHNLDGTSLYGANIGCPTQGCNGFELTTDLNLDTNLDGVIDANDEYWNSDFEGNGLGWLPIGTPLSRFSAIFEGNGFVIKNLYINRIAGDYIGLFGFIDSAEIRNVGLTGPLAYVKGNNQVAALVAQSQLSKIHTSYNTGPVYGKFSVGGLVGIANSSNITASFNTGYVFGIEWAGGLIGQAYDSNIIANFNTGDVNATSHSIGGLIGSAIYSNVIANFSTGKVHHNSNIGGLLGLVHGGSSNNNYWAIDSSNQTDSYASSNANNYVGLSLKTLRCAINANTIPYDDPGNCLLTDKYVGGTTIFTYLYSGWNAQYLEGQAEWDFGSDRELPGLKINGVIYRDSDGDGILDDEDQYIFDSDNDGVDNRDDAYPFISLGNLLDSDKDGIPNDCDASCINLGMINDDDDDNDGVLDTHDAFALNPAAALDNDVDQLPDEWLPSCDLQCQNESGLTLDSYLRDTDNDGIPNSSDNDDNGDNIIDADANSNGLIDISTLAQLNAIRHQLDGAGLRMEVDGALDQSGCPIYSYNSIPVNKCRGYELMNDLDFDTNLDGTMDENDEFWNADNNGNGQGWEPIGDTGKSFSAFFQGNGHVIRNLYINRPAEPFVGFFGSTDYASVENIGFTGPLMSVTGAHLVGAIIGYAKSNTSIISSFNTGAIYGGASVGGLVGHSHDITIGVSFNTGSVNVTGSNYAGGLIGSIGAGGLIHSSFNAASVNGDNSYTGGLVGSGNNADVMSSYWAIDSSMQDSSAGVLPNEDYFGTSLTSLQCVDHANATPENNNCLSLDSYLDTDDSFILYSIWDSVGSGQARWNFGNARQLPGLKINGVIYRDSDADGILDEDDQFVFDTDNDGVDNRDDAYPYISLGNLADVDGDGIPNECDQACTDLGMNRDIDNDNDGVADIDDAYPMDPTEWSDSNGNGIADNAEFTIKRPSTIPTHIAYNGWSTMMHTLSGQNTGNSTFPEDMHDPSLYALVGEMYLANGLYDYTYDFKYLPETSDAINGQVALDHIENTSASVIVLSAFSGDIISSSESIWKDHLYSAAQKAKQQNIIPILFQAWGNSTESNTFHNALKNSDDLQSRTSMLVIRSAEIVDKLREINPEYILNANSPNGKHTTPVNHLYSGDVTDDHSASYALAYANALATFKVLTGISARDNAFVIPSSSKTGEKYGMSEEFIEDIIKAVDNIQQETLITNFPDGSAPIASYATRNITLEEEYSVNVALAVNLRDDKDILIDNLSISLIRNEHFDSYSFTNNVFKFVRSDDYTGTTGVQFTYHDSDMNIETFYLNLRTLEPQVIEPQEIIIGFGEGDWSSFIKSGNLYNHSETESGKVINGIRGFDDLATQRGLKDTNGNTIGSITSYTKGILTGPGFTANAIAGFSDYGPYTALYNGLSIAPSGERVAFSINGLEEGTRYRINMAGRYIDETENIVHVSVNGVEGVYDSDGHPYNNSEYEKIVTVNKDGKLVVTLKSNGQSLSDYWGISYIHINKIMGNENPDVAVAPILNTHPEVQQVTLGSNATFKVEATSAESYQWYRNDVLIEGAIAQQYTLTTQASDDGVEFSVLATNVNGYVMSDYAILNISTGMPTIEEQPIDSVSVFDGDHLVLNVVASDALSYQWQQDGMDLVGETQSRLSIPVSLSDNRSIFTVQVSNAFGYVTSDVTSLTVTEESLEYWFSFGRNDGQASSFNSYFSNATPNTNAFGYNGESINFIRSFPSGTITHTNNFKNSDGNLTDLSVTFSNIGTNSNPINGWHQFNPDVLLNSNVMLNLALNSWLEHTNLYAYHVYMANDQVMQFDFSQGGLNPGDSWQVQALGLHYQDKYRPVDIMINNEGPSGNMLVGDWDNISVFEQATTVDANGNISIRITPQVNANINAIRLTRSH